MVFSQLIPGLPNDLALVCLVCLSAKDLRRVQEVSPLWRIAIQSDRFYVERRRRRPYLSVFSILIVPSGYECLDADFEDIQNPRLLFSCDRERGQLLFPPGVVFASVDAAVYSFAPGHYVQRFSLLTRRWTQLSKLFPPSSQLMVATVGSLVVAIICKKQKSDDADDAIDVGSDDAGPAPTGCEILDTHTNLWMACAEGLPQDFYGRGCFTHQGQVFIKAEGRTEPSAIYNLNVRQKRWVVNAHMSEVLDPLQDVNRIILHNSSALCMVFNSPMVNLCSLNLSTGRRTVVLSLTMPLPLPSSYFLFQQDGQFYVTNQGGGWKIDNVFYYHSLNILHIPGNPLMVDAITGGQAIH